MSFEIVASYDIFIDTLVEEIKKQYNASNEYDYVVLLYYIIYDRIVTLIELSKFIYIIDIYEDRYQSALCKLGNLQKSNTLRLLRDRLGIKNSVEISDIVYNYTYFNKYLYCSRTFFMDEFLVDIKSLLDSYEILSSKNKWDYVMIFNYILYEDNLIINRIDNKDNELFSSLSSDTINNFNKLELALNPYMYELIDETYSKEFKWDISENYYVKISKRIDRTILDVALDKAKNEITNNLFSNKPSIAGVEEFYKNKYIRELVNNNTDLDIVDVFNILINECNEVDNKLIDEMNLAELYRQHQCDDIDKQALRDKIRKMKKSYENNKNKFVKGKF